MLFLILVELYVPVSEAVLHIRQSDSNKAVLSNCDTKSQWGGAVAYTLLRAH